MVENQHKHIKGYRDLSPEEIAAMNKVKAMAEAVGNLQAEIAGMAGVDGRAAAIAKADLQTGFMWLVRAIAQPTTF